MKTLLCSALLLLTFSLNAQAPTAVSIPQEPHHHLVLENAYVRVFRVSVPAHESTLLHQHDVPYLYVSLGPADVINAVQGKPEAHLVMADGQLGYSAGHFAHIARNESNAPFNNVTIELLKPQGEPQNLCAQVVPGFVAPCDKAIAFKGRGYAVVPQFETADTKVSLIQLDPGAEHLGMSVETCSLLVALGKSEVRIETNSKPSAILKEGEVSWITADPAISMSNPSNKHSSVLWLVFHLSGARSPCG
jgi:hypothetical protein